jgi:hypothetical protein
LLRRGESGAGGSSRGLELGRRHLRLRPMGRAPTSRRYPLSFSRCSNRETPEMRVRRHAAPGSARQDPAVAAGHDLETPGSMRSAGRDRCQQRKPRHRDIASRAAARSSSIMPICAVRDQCR